MSASQANAQAKTLLPKPLARARAAPSCRNELGQKLKQSGLLEHHPAHDHYVREVWELLARWVPGLDAYWLQKVEPKLGFGLADPSPNPNPNRNPHPHPNPNPNPHTNTNPDYNSNPHPTLLTFA